MQTGVHSADLAETTGFGLESILLPVDFDESNCIAAHQARVLARRFKASVTLLHVTEMADHLVSLPAETERVAQSRLQTFGTEQLRGVHASSVLSSGDPAARIVEFANNED